jgi:hypothetical protein
MGPAKAKPVLRVADPYSCALYPFIDIEAFIDFCAGTLMTSDCVDS